MSNYNLATRLRSASRSYYEWRVQDPKTECYCISFKTERDANEWFDDHKNRLPNSQFFDYEIARVKVETYEDKLMQEAATEIEQLLLAEEGAKEAFTHVVQQKKDLEKDCDRLRRLLESAYQDINLLRKQTQGKSCQ